MKEVIAEIEWKPTLFYCEDCEDVIFSAQPGQYDRCGCGNSFVDQTRYYIRLGGSARPVEDRLEERKLENEQEEVTVSKSANTYRKYMEKVEKAHGKLPTPPYHYHFGILLDGSFDIRESTVLVPEEALRLGRWLVSFYSDCEENI